MLTSLLGTSKRLVTALEKADWLDRILIFAALTFFFLVFLFILKQRIVDRGLRIAFWWTRFIPSIGQGDSAIDYKQVMIDNAAVASQSGTAVTSSVIASTAAALASQVPHAAKPVLTVSLAEEGVNDALHASADPSSTDSNLFETTSTLHTAETPPPESIHDEL